MFKFDPALDNNKERCVDCFTLKEEFGGPCHYCEQKSTKRPRRRRVTDAYAALLDYQSGDDIFGSDPDDDCLPLPRSRPPPPIDRALTLLEDLDAETEKNYKKFCELFPVGPYFYNVWSDDDDDDEDQKKKPDEKREGDGKEDAKKDIHIDTSPVPDHGTS